MLSKEINLVIPLGDTGDKSVFLQAGVLGRMASPWILVKVLNLEELNLPNLLVICKRNEQKHSSDEAAKLPDVKR